MRKFIILCYFFCLMMPIAISTGRQAVACTIWAAAGERTSDQGTLLGKNRDWWADHDQELRFVAPVVGFRFLAIQPRGGKRPRDIAGVNEKGLAIVTAAASCLSLKDRARAGGLTGLTNIILGSCATVRDVVKRQDLFTAPGHYMVADQTKIGIIEVGLNGKRSSKVTDNDILFHTNHYLDKNLSEDNKKFDLSSQLRLIRIRYLLNAHHEPFTVQDFIAFSQDRHDGPDNSIWRDGSSPGNVRTISTWIVSLPKNDFPTLYVKLADPDEPAKMFRLRLDPSFWRKGLGFIWHGSTASPF